MSNFFRKNVKFLEKCRIFLEQVDFFGEMSICLEKCRIFLEKCRFFGKMSIFWTWVGTKAMRWVIVPLRGQIWRTRARIGGR